MIHPQRLDKYIYSREWIHSVDYVLDSISGMTKEQFRIIRLKLNENRKYDRITQSYNKK